MNLTSHILTTLVVLMPSCAAFADDCAQQADLSGEPPAALVAMLSPDCYDHALKDLTTPQTALDYGYPSRLFGLVSDAEASEIMALSAAEGDRGFFAADGDILTHLDAIGDRSAADFVIASLAPAATLKKGPASPDFLMALPLWGRPENSRLLVQYCKQHDCEATRTQCPDQVGFADKLAVAQGKMTLDDAQVLCPASFEWLRALRQAGLVDTACTSAMQINMTMANPDLIGEACYPPGLSLDEVPAASAADAIRLIRSYLTQPDAAPMTAGSIDYIAGYWPDVADYFNELHSRGE